MNSPGNDGAGTLYVVGTPIGNLSDLTPRAREVLARAAVVAAEDTRRTQGLLSRIGLNVRLIAFHEHNERERTPELVEALARGESVALVSDAGTPLISDPGWRLVRDARARGIRVVPVPGPSAVIAALCAAGLPTDRFVFEGFLPRRAAQRAERLAALAREPRTLVFFEAVHRLPETLAAMAERLGAEREAVLARELTKVHESFYTGTLGELAARAGADIPLLGEFVILVHGAEEAGSAEDAEALRVYGLLAAELPPGKAVALTAAITGLPRNKVYRLARVEPR
ncbi:MAG TPA: 16S rRNA (cytidine(1402)-2'-O)-methyltransferase [Gammaproteobacteria bacterium]